MRKFISLAAILLLSTSAIAEVKGLIRLTGVNATGPDSYQDDGTGLFRYTDSDLVLSQALLSADFDLGADFSFHGVANAYSDGEQQLGFTQAYFKYQPLMAGKTKVSAKAGFFYPALSVENTDIGWLSSHYLTNSAINSWIGEELRTAGLEITIKRPGRQRRSPWSWQFHAAGFKGNDTLGALLTWRGFALHDRQSLNNDEVNFAPFPAVVDPNILNSPSWNQPFHEVDKRWGFYLGVQANYLRKFDVRYYYYDNNADPNVVNRERLYSWHTKFHSVAARYMIDKDLELSMQLMHGDTIMGYKLVYADYSAGFISLTKKWQDHKVSARIERFVVSEDKYDMTPEDINSSRGSAFTLNWTYAFSDNLELALEGTVNKNQVDNRLTIGEEVESTDTLTQVAATYRF